MREGEQTQSQALVANAIVPLSACILKAVAIRHCARVLVVTSFSLRHSADEYYPLGIIS